MLFNEASKDQALRLTPLKGRTAAVLDHTNLGVYRLDEDRCLLIDSSNGGTRMAKIAAMLEQQGLRIAAVVNTHGHADHCGGNAWLQARGDCPVWAADEAALLMEYPILIAAQIFSAYPPRVLTNRFVMPEASRVDQKFKPGVFTVEGHAFEAIALPGHSHGHVGIRTPDDIIFSGDALITEEFLQLNRMLVILNLEEFLATLHKMKELPAELFIPGHGDAFTDAAELAEINLAFINDMLELILERCAAPCTRESIMKTLIAHYGMSMNSTQYYLLLSTLSACLSGLTRQKRLKLKYSDGTVVFVEG